ncbi:MAG: amidohydrolase family protein [Bryobacteraceae bacterium]
MNGTMSRRHLLAGGAAVAASALLGNRAVAAGAAQAKKRGPAALPARGEFIIRNAYVMTMERETGDIADGDVHFKNGEILAVGKALKAPGATVIDGQKMIVLPGIVETHWHTWNTLLRSFAGEKPDQGYFPTAAVFGAQMSPEDMYRGTRLATLEAINSGTTTLHSFCHNLRSREHGEGDIRALRESGIRARWSWGWPQGLPDTQVSDLAGLEAMHRDWAKFANDGLLTMGFAWRGMFRNTQLAREVYKPEFDAARKLGLPISLHVASSETTKGQVEAHAKEGLLGKDVQIIHALSVTPAEIEMVAKSGTQVSVSPGSELRIGYGFTKISEYLDAGVPLGVSIDNTALSGDANMFGILKMIRNIENAKKHDEFAMTARRVLELGTIDGAKTLGLGDRIGSLKPGKRADIVMISLRAPNMGVFSDPSHLVVEATQPENVDTVIVDGRILKRNGKLTAMATDQILADADASFAALRKKVNR